MEDNMSTKNLLKVDEGLRPRANSDPTMGGKIITPFQMPEIMIEDCADNDELVQIDSQKDQGGLFGQDAIPRRRANTCPEDLFRRRRTRPPTPPPTSYRKDPRTKMTILKPPMKEAISFAHHRLGKLAEDSSEGVSPSLVSCGSDRSRSKSITAIPFRKPLSDSLVPSSGFCEHTSGGLASSDPAEEDSHSSRLSRLPKLGDCSDEEEEEGAAAAAEADNNSSESGGSADDLPRKSSKDCRFSETKPPGIDSAQLQAC